MTARGRPLFQALFIGTLQLGFVLVIVGGTFFASNYMRENQPPRVQVETNVFIPVIQTETVQLSERQITRQGTGSIEPSVEVAITPEVSGVIATVRPGLGDGAIFEAGEVLFQLDRRDLEIALTRSETDLATARATLDIERAQAENAIREWESFGQGEISDLAARGPQVRSAEAQVAQARASLETARLNLVRSGFTLPFDGRIIELGLAPGQTVTAGQSYGQVYGFDQIEISVSFGQSDLAPFPNLVGTPAMVSATLLGQKVSFDGQVSRVAGEFSRTTRLATLIVTPEPGAGLRNLLLPGGFVTVTLQGPVVPDTVEVPNAALQDDDRVWLVEGGALTLSDPLQIIQRGRETTILTGLGGGTEIALGTTAGAIEGMPVQTDAALALPLRDREQTVLVDEP
ncbi:MAG: efflux RND transporter periplasmic adaptor subunit [Roseicyclus sp.]|nr:efflux RND transporter periplasmic adaptor subunit [Roseicyclus sp.]